MSQTTFELKIEPPTAMVQFVPRLALREALRLAKKFGRHSDETNAFFYSTEDSIYLELGGYRQEFDLEGDWSGCASVKASLILPFWNSLPKCNPLLIRYDRGWIHFCSLAMGKSVWQPKYDPDWVS